MHIAAAAPSERVREWYPGVALRIFVIVVAVSSSRAPEQNIAGRVHVWRAKRYNRHYITIITSCLRASENYCGEGVGRVAVTSWSDLYTIYVSTYIYICINNCIQSIQTEIRVMMYARRARYIDHPRGSCDSNNSNNNNTRRRIRGRRYNIFIYIYI